MENSCDVVCLATGGTLLQIRNQCAIFSVRCAENVQTTDASLMYLPQASAKHIAQFLKRRTDRALRQISPGTRGSGSLRRSHGGPDGWQGLRPAAMGIAPKGLARYLVSDKRSVSAMLHTWRWFGPHDRVSLSDARQAGATGIVTALHERRPGEVWSAAEIKDRKQLIEEAGLTWSVVESLPVSESIRTAGPEAEAHIANWVTSMENLVEAGISTICYNFMPVLDWTRTDLHAPMATGATAMRFDLTDFAMFDIHILGRDAAEADYPAPIRTAAEHRFAALPDGAADALSANILAGLPGAAEHWNLEAVRAHLAHYAEIDADTLRANFANFLRAVVPEAERLGARLCCHPDDPPWPLLGLPRIMSTEDDLRWLVDTVPSPANGITFCTGSLGARPDNDLPGMVARLGPHIHFLHLRSVRREDDTVPGSFYEDEHLAGSTDMIAVIRAVVQEEARRRAEGRDDAQIPMRPDHGQDILDDQARRAQPGYPAIGRLKGLAEIRGAAMAIERVLTGQD